VSKLDNATVSERPPLLPERSGLALAGLGVLAFSLTFPMTKLALRGFSPWFISMGRSVVAAVLGAITLRMLAARVPSRRELMRLGVVVIGVVFGFPALSTLALQTSSAAHGAVVIAMLPVATAVVSVIRTRESSGPLFWVCALSGAAVVTGYTISRAGGSLRLSDLYLLGAVLVCAFGYAEGGMLARTLGAPQTICWALILALPVTAAVAFTHLPGHTPGARSVTGFVYVSLCSSLLGFFAWYGGMARVGVARASQVQLAQTPMTLVWSALILGERIGWDTALVAAAVLICITGTQRARSPELRRSRSARGRAMPYRPLRRRSAPGEP
jgi:drug/metabolite transporter (DMT)-like permease